MLEILKIIDCDIYRDGGSYGLRFYSTQNLEYELFIPIVKENNLLNSNQKIKKYDSPVIYKLSVNTGIVIETLTWEEANIFLQNIDLKNNRFTELINIVANKGIINQ